MPTPGNFDEYAEYYDVLYQDKDYASEAAFVDQIVSQHFHKVSTPLDLLDMACGTGRHATELAKLGYCVKGSDVSPNMVKVAMQRIHDMGLNIPVFNESFQTSNHIDHKFDVVIAMFAAINYVVDYSELVLSFQNIASLLKPGGLFIFDFWNGNAVINDYFKERTKIMEHQDRKVVRTSNTTLDLVTQRAFVDFDFELIKNGEVESAFSEEHVIRYFFLQEMTDNLAVAGLEVIHRCPFLKADDNLNGREWNVTYVARLRTQI